MCKQSTYLLFTRLMFAMRSIQRQTFNFKDYGLCLYWYSGYKNMAADDKKIKYKLITNIIHNNRSSHPQIRSC